ncbi:DUF3981 domain-containing protein [Bacillus massiliigorillae]|uniref:DUF3981 domain-containing protein n=1 Tax=Bacillus massiliigorillae TaxID=1243664 RepID=UPI00039F598F|nr:DUF3981 domain-containing protein [Bacillus massiliigorillae]
MKFIVLLLLSLCMLPFSKERVLKLPSFIIPLLFWVIVGSVEYFFLLDNNVSSVLVFYALLSGVCIFLSTLFPVVLEASFTKELLIKVGLSLLLGLSFIYFGMIHGLFTGKDRYEAVHHKSEEISELITEKDTPFVVPPETARNKMKKVFGNIDQVSYYELGELTPQNVNGEFVYVAPIESSSFMKARKAGHLPGYITMSGTDPDAEAELHNGFKMKYAPSLYFRHNLERLVRKSEPSVIFKGEPTLEIDDDGTPYYVMTYGNFVSGRSGFDPKGVVVINPQTGKVQKYTTKDAPTFIDGVVNDETADYLNETFGTMVHGVFNSWFSNTDVKEPTFYGEYETVTPIFAKDGSMYYFTDFTSPKEEIDSALGYSLVNGRTGEVVYYSGKQIDGVMDSSGAVEVVDNSFKKEKWTGTMPVLYNIYGNPSWLVPVVDNGGLIRAYAVVSGTNAKVFASGTTIKEALKKYNTALEKKTAISKPSSEIGKEKTIEGEVLRVFKETREDDETIVYILLKNQETVFVVSSVDFIYSKFVEVNDRVKITYKETGQLEVAVSDFVNMNLNK